VEGDVHLERDVRGRPLDHRRDLLADSGRRLVFALFDVVDEQVVTARGRALGGEREHRLALVVVAVGDEDRSHATPLIRPRLEFVGGVADRDSPPQEHFCEGPDHCRQSSEMVSDASVPVEDLRAAGFGDEVEKVATAVAGYLDDGVGGNVAVVSDPYAGRDSLLAYAESLLDGELVRVDLDPTAADGTGPELPDPDELGADGDGEGDRNRNGNESTDGDSDDTPGAGVLVVANCHYLFGRRIDGFAALDAFLDRIALSETLVLTSWNRYAWSYLDAVRDVGDTFPTTVEIPRLDAEEIATVVEAHFGPDLPDIVDTGSAGRVKTIVFDSWRVGLPRGRSLAVPYPKFNPAWTASWSITGESEGIEAVTFEKLRRVSAGNPGVALAVWEESVTDGQIAPGYIEAFATDLGLDDDAATLLWTVVAQESVGIDRLSALFDRQPVEATVQKLVERGFVTVDDDCVTVPPRALHPAVVALERRGMLW